MGHTMRPPALLRLWTEGRWDKRVWRSGPRGPLLCKYFPRDARHRQSAPLESQRGYISGPTAEHGALDWAIPELRGLGFRSEFSRATAPGVGSPTSRPSLMAAQRASTAGGGGEFSALPSRSTFPGPVMGVAHPDQGPKSTAARWVPWHTTKAPVGPGSREVPLDQSNWPLSCKAKRSPACPSSLGVGVLAHQLTDPATQGGVRDGMAGR